MNRDKRKYPLRRIVSEGLSEHGVQTETLECGHVVHRREDIYGPTNAYARRCRKCAPAKASEGEGE